MKHPGHTYGGFVSAISERGMTWPVMGMIWARKCWSARGMSGHKSAGPSKGVFCPSSAGTLTCIKLIVKHPLRAFCYCARIVRDCRLLSLFSGNDWAEFALHQVT
jgi:hypothetical protein